MDHAEILARLETVIAGRLGGDPASSYVARLHAKGTGKIAQKVGEEATEVVIAALTGDAVELTGEAADLVFHLMVLLGARGVAFDAVLAELARREGTSGIVEKASRRD
ncbi:phosphoribosyl-ATP diphosphatase [Novosphingobium sp. Fuku2-ISO-50]|jgi:phosphoribosyl-ATP pyrophosphohydrolase|uniref:phosphoribosyl-ATP diphosphatase n=1 Tax=Novosphingobium sp. Fuku2-ISO-50 TaxID=1739114 RepID=UPI00076CD069|nr:phosphoribosyl-ATP diphosphatase [Novosphingobium sp. Fuku2-ISO-50]KUR78475.1 phosphoribosyl-ATP pyrophosphatase [Novosphingobium sp. Fuku2-ISO-50]